MLFSQPEVASFLSSAFECAWESVRPVPRVTVDFGNGHRLERTLRGNIATYVCTSAGQTIDLIPGLVDGEEYTARLQQSLAFFHSSSVASRDARSLEENVRIWHDALAGVGVREAVVNYSKAAVESPIERGLIPPQSSAFSPLPVFAASKARVEKPIEQGFSKFRVEDPLQRGVASAQKGFDDSGLSLDTAYARTQGYQLAHRFLADRALGRPAELQRDVYRELLHVELEDPYLGLAPQVIGGEPGRN